MAKHFVVRREAEAELNEAFVWYEDRVPGLGSDFLLQVDACFNTILRTPELYPVVHRNIRRAILRRFPYEVFYVIDEPRISILAIFHSKRDPKHWKDRG
jgi:plasmid stabilization system protein ParE